MNKLTDLQEQWLKSLESGEWSQCKDYLRDGDSYCCLGVATVICDPHNSALFGIFRSNGWNNAVDEGEQTAPPKIQLKMMFRTSEGGRGVANLSVMNDEGKSFAEIASFVRANPHLVFTNFDDLLDDTNPNESKETKT